MHAREWVMPSPPENRIRHMSVTAQAKGGGGAPSIQTLVNPRSDGLGPIISGRAWSIPSPRSSFVCRTRCLQDTEIYAASPQALKTCRESRQSNRGPRLDSLRQVETEFRLSAALRCLCCRRHPGLGLILIAVREIPAAFEFFSFFFFSSSGVMLSPAPLSQAATWTFGMTS